MKIRLVDSTFHNPSFTLWGENASEAPKHIQWDRDAEDGPISVYTDIRLPEVVDSPSEKNYALLIEPRCFSDTHYVYAEEFKDYFDAIFTYDAEAQTGEPFRPYALGGSLVRDWGVYEKNKLVSMLISDKQVTEGHHLRHEAAELYGDRMDIFGPPHTEWLDSKVSALRPYRYSVVIESCRHDYYFSEKLIDCFSQGTIPIYWGCPLISYFFDEHGIIEYEDLNQLDEILSRLSPEHYARHLSDITFNWDLAWRYRCAEDWIYEHYGWLFGG